MSRFLSEKYAELTPYTPGEQPQGVKLIKLNTNESPFPPSPKAVAAVAKAAENLQLYSDPECRALRRKAAEVWGIKEENMLFTNGSDEILDFAFKAFCDDRTPAVFPQISYGFYRVFAKCNGLPSREIPLKSDLSIEPADYSDAGGTVILANPNAPTGVLLPLCAIEEIVRNNRKNVLVIDEAYIDFGGESAVGLIGEYDNLLVTQTFSKSRSMAGARLGVGFASKGLIEDLNKIKYSFNPYNVNSMTACAGIGALSDEAYTKENCRAIIKNRAILTEELRALGFELPESNANFVFARHPEIDGEKLYEKLRRRGILVRHFSDPAIAQYNRITVGREEDMKTLISAIKAILSEEKERSKT